MSQDFAVAKWWPTAQKTGSPTGRSQGDALKQLLIYDQIVPLTRHDHGKLSLQKMDSFAFARETNAMPLVGPEFPLAAHDYAIVFTDTGEGIVPAVILGVRNNENLYVDADGKWNANYVPAFARRYPFAFGTDDSENFTVMIDPSFPGFNAEDKGERLFNPDGSNAPFLDTTINFLREYQGMFARTQTFGKRLGELGVLDPVEANLPLPSDPGRKLTGFKIVNRDRLKALPNKAIADLLREDELDLVVLHLLSLRNLGRLQEKLAPTPDRATA